MHIAMVDPVLLLEIMPVSTLCADCYWKNMESRAEQNSKASRAVKRNTMTEHSTGKRLH